MPERPRDRLGRPLPQGSAPDAAIPPVPSIHGLDDDAVWALAIACLDDGLPFHAHEVFEQRWRDAAPADRDAWRACAQWGAALTHAARGNPFGASRLAARAMDTLDDASGAPPAIDADRLRASCLNLLRNHGNEDARGR